MLMSELKQLEIGDWLYGLGSAGISGGASALSGFISVNIVDPGHWNVVNGRTWLLMSMIFVTSAIFNIANYLKQSPLPARRTVEKTTETTETTKVVEIRPNPDAKKE